MQFRVLVVCFCVISEAYQWEIQLQSAFTTDASNSKDNYYHRRAKIRKINGKYTTPEIINSSEDGAVKEIILNENEIAKRNKRETNETETRILKETEERVLKNINSNDSKVQTCGGIFSQLQFIIETPNYPSNYQHNLDCLFIFKGPLCETNYTLQFLDFNVEDSIGCTSDRLEIKYKDALCGIHEGVRSYLTKNGILELNFISNENISARGFRILVSRSACLKNERTTTEAPAVTKNGMRDFTELPEVNNKTPPEIPSEDTPSRFIPPSYPPSGHKPQYPSSGYLPPGNKSPHPPIEDKFPYPPSGYLPVGGKYPYPHSGDKFPYPPPGEKFPYPPSGYLPAGDTYPYPHLPSGKFPYPPSEHPQSNPKQRACCASTYSAKRFYISSPGFPHSNEHPTECTFTIYRATPKVCRARILLHYFSIGEQDRDCTKGYLQIDGKLLCGCKTGIRLLSPFDQSFGNTKVFRFKNLATPYKTYTGFAIEIIQDECPERYLPSDEKAFNFYNDQVNRIAWPNLTNDELLIKAESLDNTEFFEPIDLGFKPRVIKHVYFFDTPTFYDGGYDVTYNYNKPRDVEESTYIDTSDITSSFPKPEQDSTACAVWGLAQYTELTRDVLWQRMPKCNDLSVYPEMSKCKDYNFIKGYFQSPGYPYYYPKNLNICYRFSKQRGFCKIRLIMLDFQVDQSYDCSKDYLLINGNFRYCGKSLANTFTLFDMIGKNYEEIKFITDGQSGGRGFRGIYEQIPCGGETTNPHPHHHHHHVHTTLPPVKTTPTEPLTEPLTTPPPDLPCSRTIMEGYFTIDIYDYGKDTCDFVVRKSKNDVCRIEISFSTFDLDCNAEQLSIDGEKFCGRLSGRRMTFDFEEGEIKIQYKRFSVLNKGTGLKLHLVGRQVSENCIVKLPPVQRILQADHRDGKQFNFKNNTGLFNSSKNQSTIIILQRKHKEVCGVFMNLKAPNITESLCDVLSVGEGKSLDCSSITERTFYVPYNKSDKLELKFKNAETAREVEFKEITCDNKFIL